MTSEVYHAGESWAVAPVYLGFPFNSLRFWCGAQWYLVLCLFVTYYPRVTVNMFSRIRSVKWPATQVSMYPEV